MLNIQTNMWSTCLSLYFLQVERKPFQKVIDVSSDDSHRAGMKPFSFVRQVEYHSVGLSIHSSVCLAICPSVFLSISQTVDQRCVCIREYYCVCLCCITCVCTVCVCIPCVCTVLCVLHGMYCAVCITCVLCVCVMTQVLAGCLYPELLHGDSLPQDARKRVRDLLRGCDGGSVGELKDSLSKHPETLIPAHCVTLQPVSPC